MKKFKFAFTLFTVVFVALVLTLSASAATTDNQAFAENVFKDIGPVTFGDKYFYYTDEVDAQPVPGDVAIIYLQTIGAFDRYYNETTDSYSVGYDDFISAVDRNFAYHNDMLDYLRENNLYDEEAGIVTWSEELDVQENIDWIPLHYYSENEYIWVSGAVVEYIDPDSLEELIIGKDFMFVGENPVAYIENVLLTLKNTADGWKILEYKTIDYRIVDGVLYSEFGEFFSFSVESDSNSILTSSPENDAIFIDEFKNTGARWYDGHQHSLTYNIKAEENYEIDYVIVSDINGDTAYTPDENGVCTFDIVENAVLKVKTKGIPRFVDINGIFYYYIGNDFAGDFTGLVKMGQLVYYVENGIVRTDYTGLICDNGVYYYIANGAIDFGYTGFCEYNDSYYYVKSGRLDWSYKGLINYDNIWYYIENCKVNFDYTGLCEHYGGFYHIVNGVLDWNYTGLSQYNGGWYYVENGVYTTGYTGLTFYGGVWYYVTNGVLDWSVTTLTNYYDVWYYVENGKINWDYTGLTFYDGIWYYVTNGFLDWSVTTLTNYYDVWYYVENGTINWNYTGLCEYYGGFYHIANGVIDWSYSGLSPYNGGWYYVENGVYTNATVLCDYEDTVYFVENGAVNFNFTGFVQLQEYYLFVENGIWNTYFTGTVELIDGTICYVEEGVLVGME